ncbi:hypothetical protein [Rhodococcus sp. RDE2]|uniref:hypothetical protein n=1 Tax=Rhodococcus sp. RDE2 TaxID=2885078 RepID=UPI001E3B6F4C|nr:hypothetical protein [Rhodococcus sp. RDE2]BDB61753.1 hypothetical protein RDE2_35470 [Rhodococcus sp. RDE2]
MAICAVVDYATRYSLAITVTPTSTEADTVACVGLAVAEAQRILDLDDLRNDRGLMDAVDDIGTVTGQAPASIALVSVLSQWHVRRTVRQRRSVASACADPGRSLQTNGVIEGFFGTSKYEHVHRGSSIGDGDAPDMEVHRYQNIDNTIQSHRAVSNRIPSWAYRPGNR